VKFLLLARSPKQITPPLCDVIADAGIICPGAASAEDGITTLYFCYSCELAKRMPKGSH
jgi:hypothetical protein